MSTGRKTLECLPNVVDIEHLDRRSRRLNFNLKIRRREENELPKLAGGFREQQLGSLPSNL